MSDLQWIRFSSGIEKQVPIHLAFNPDLQRVQSFSPIEGPGGNTISATNQPTAEKKADANPVAGNVDTNKSTTDIVTDGETIEEKWIAEYKAGKSFAQIAYGSGVHWKKVEKVIKDAEKK